MDVRRAAQREVDHAAGDCRIGHTVDQDERAHAAIFSIGLECNGAIKRKIAGRDLVEVEVLGGEVLERVHVDLVLELRHLRGHQDGAGLQEIRSPGKHRLLAHPDDVSGKLLRDGRRRSKRREHIAAADVDLLRERQRNRLSSHRLTATSCRTCRLMPPPLLTTRSG